MTNDEKIAWCRAQGVLQAQWNTENVLLMCVLGPERVEQPKEEPKFPMKTTEEEYEDLLCASS
jgi:hypothetical protein